MSPNQTSQDAHEKDGSPDPNTFYGRSNAANIGTVTLGNYKFQPWFGNAAYFYPHEGSHDMLGYEYANQVALDPMSRRRSKVHEEENELWINGLNVCEYCFKYSAAAAGAAEATDYIIAQHTRRCSLNTARPKIGRLIYYDYEKDIIVREVRGFREPLFCQNLCLFGKLFLEDKSVYYNVEHFNFYIYYAKENTKGKSNFIPMGFFSKEMIPNESSNNLACICVFPPFQRRRIGATLIELSYRIARHESYECSGPEVPLSPFGQIAYLKFWSKKLVSILTTRRNVTKPFTLEQLSQQTGYRKEDILFTFEHMGVLVVKGKMDQVVLSYARLQHWITANNLQPPPKPSPAADDENLIQEKFLHL
ncbi:uncharacterized protein LODBEIA_P45320 [Lodderomyces beijingensis]|uniref:histone acetyltransferase n=1 Tax=Lodderomyces beijingensis TaxID=1775926 RepID=A0ABP0ZRJ7_9ASCO